MSWLIVDQQRPFDPLDRTDLSGIDIVDIDVAGQLCRGLDERSLITKNQSPSRSSASAMGTEL